MTKSPFAIVSDTPARGIELYETADSSQRKILVTIGLKDIPNPNAGIREKLEHVRYLLEQQIKSMP